MTETTSYWVWQRWIEHFHPTGCPQTSLIWTTWRHS